MLIILRQEASVKLIFQHSKKIKTGLFGSTFQELFKFKKWEPFLGHLVERTDASKFQIFKIQINKWQLSIKQMFENPRFLRFKGEWTY